MAARLTTKTLFFNTTDKRFKSGKRVEAHTFYKVLDGDEELYSSPSSHQATLFMTGYNLGWKAALAEAAREAQLLCVDV